QRRGPGGGRLVRPSPWTVGGSAATGRLPCSCRVAPVVTKVPLTVPPSAWLFSSVRVPPGRSEASPKTLARPTWVTPWNVLAPPRTISPVPTLVTAEPLSAWFVASSTVPIRLNRELAVTLMGALWVRVVGPRHMLSPDRLVSGASGCGWLGSSDPGTLTPSAGSSAVPVTVMIGAASTRGPWKVTKYGPVPLGWI